MPLESGSILTGCIFYHIHVNMSHCSSREKKEAEGNGYQVDNICHFIPYFHSFESRHSDPESTDREVY